MHETLFSMSFETRRLLEIKETQTRTNCSDLRSGR